MRYDATAEVSDSAICLRWNLLKNRAGDDLGLQARLPRWVFIESLIGSQVQSVRVIGRYRRFSGPSAAKGEEHECGVGFE